MSSVNSIYPSGYNAVTKSDVDKVAANIEAKRKAGDLESVATMEAEQFGRIINDPSLKATEKFNYLLKVAGGTFSPAQNLMISNLFQDFSQAMTMLTNMVKIVHETMMSAVRNIRA